MVELDASLEGRIGDFRAVIRINIAQFATRIAEIIQKGKALDHLLNGEW